MHAHCISYPYIFHFHAHIPMGFWVMVLNEFVFSSYFSIIFINTIEVGVQIEKISRILVIFICICKCKK